MPKGTACCVCLLCVLVVCVLSNILTLLHLQIFECRDAEELTDDWLQAKLRFFD
jgi:hypothetical protein